MGEVIVHLALHAMHLLPDGAGEVGLARAIGEVGFLEQYGQRRLEAMSQVARFGLRQHAEEIMRVYDSMLSIGAEQDPGRGATHPTARYPEPGEAGAMAPPQSIKASL